MKKYLLLILSLSITYAVNAQSKGGFKNIPVTKIQKNVQKNTGQHILYSEIKPTSGTEFRLVKTTTDKKGNRHYTYQQYFNNIKVAFGIIKLHERNGLKESYNGAYFNTTGVRTSSSLSNSQVISAAKQYMNSATVFWPSEAEISKTTPNTPELTILPNLKTTQLNLAYKITIGAYTPELRLGELYIDATTGKILKYKNQLFACFESHNNEIEHQNHEHEKKGTMLASGTATTAYSGSKSFVTKLDGNYILNDETRANGSNWGLSTQGLGTKTGIITVDIKTGTDVSGSLYEFTDSDNNWTAAEMSSNEDQYALDVHWGSQVVYDYWKNVHGRESYNGSDSALLSIVHFGDNYLNAAWAGVNSNSGYMFYGDGSGAYTPLTTLDVISHEIAHGINNSTSNLDYESESGALNEGLSDVWAMIIDNYSNTNYGTSKDISQINDENGGGALRSMSNPNAFNQPDTYGGTNWYNVSGCTPNGNSSSAGYNDYCGVHTNSGVLNYWFWLLSQGGSGTNDNGNAFSVTALGMDDAASIVWQMQNNYLTSTSNYADARTNAIQAAIDLFGSDCSQQEQSVTNAWYAVGVGAAYNAVLPEVVVDPDPLNITVCVGETIVLSAEGQYQTSQNWKVYNGTTWGSTSDGSVYSGTGTDDLTITNVTSTMDGYRYRLRFDNGCGFATTDYVTLTVQDSPVASVAITSANCSGTEDGEFIFTFSDDAVNTNIEFSIDGGSTYPYNYADNSGSQTETNIPAATYNIWTRWGNDECPIELGDYTVGSEVTASVSSIVEAETALDDGRILLSFEDLMGETAIKFSIDGGSTYPYSFDDTLGTAEISDLAPNTYNVWAITGSDNCAADLGNVIISEIAYTSIPDSNFETALDGLGYDNYLGDNKVPTALIDVVTDLPITNEGIADLTGIGDFIMLETLYCQGNNLTSIDVSNLPQLRGLWMHSSNSISELDITNNPKLTDVRISNVFTGTTIDLSQNVLLKKFFCNNNSNFTSINLSNNPDLEQLELRDTSIEVLDLSNNNVLTKLDIFSTGTLTSLNIKNGNNANVTSLDARDNPLLYCISVDDAAYSLSTTIWTNGINVNSYFSNTDCRYTAISDANFEAALDALGHDDISSDGQVPTETIEVLTSLNVDDESISDLTGIEDFVALEDLSFKSNTVNTIDLSNLVSLTHLYFQNNNIATIDLSANVLLEHIACRENGLTALDFSNNPALRNIYSQENAITEMDLSANPNLELVAFPNNLLRNFTIQNGNKEGISTFNLLGNTSLECILVDDAVYSAENWTSIETTIASYNQVDCTRYTLIPDANFESALAAYDDIANDGQVPTENIEVITSLDVKMSSISDLTGIEDFTALVELVCWDNSLTSLDVSQNINLEELVAFSNQITDINLNSNINLRRLDIGGNSLTELNVAANINLEILTCGSNAINELNVDTNMLLTLLYVDSTNISTLNLSNNTALEELQCGSTNIFNLDLFTNTSLRNLSCDNIGLTSIDLTNNTSLESIKCSDNALTTLDLSNNMVLDNLDVSNNNLSVLNVKNGTNTLITTDYFITTGNPNLYCIQVDDVAYSTTNWTNIDPTTIFSNSDCRYTYVPDDNFEEKLRDLGYDDSADNDDYVPTALIENVTELELVDFIFGLNISDLTGIEDFVALENLILVEYLSSSIDLSHNTLLKTLDLWGSNLTTIDLSSNLLLETLDVSNIDSLTTIDLSNLTALKNLDISSSYTTSNLITSIDLSDNLALETLDVSSCDNLTAIDVSYNTALKTLDISRAGLTVIDITNNIALRTFTATFTDISNIDFSNNTALRNINVNGSSIVSLDLSNNNTLQKLLCQNQKDENGDEVLTSLNIQNGSNGAINNFNAAFNSNLTCIRVDDLANDYSSWIKDATVSFSDTYCRYTYVPDDNFETVLRTLGLDDGSVNDDYVPTALIEALETLEIENEGITDLTGIEDFIALKTLDVGHNSLSTINVTNKTELRQLIVRSNNITTIDLSANTLLVGFKAENSLLTTLDLSNNLNLKVLWITGNDLTEIDLSNNIALTNFRGGSNDFETLDLSNNPDLDSFRVSNSNNLTSLNLRNGGNTNISGGTDFLLTGNPSLSCVQVDDVAYSTANWTNIDPTTIFSDLDCRYTYVPDDNFETALRALGLDDGTANDDYVPTSLIEVVSTLDVNTSNISDLTGIEDFTALTNLIAYGNSLSSLDVSNNIQLTSLTVYGNSLTALNLSNNTQLTGLYANENNIASIDISNNVLLESFYFSDNGITDLDLSANTALKFIDVSNNLFSGLDLSTNVALEYAVVGDNANLSTLNAQNGTNVSAYLYLIAVNSPNLSCILVDDISHATTVWLVDIHTGFSTTYCNSVVIAPKVFLQGALLNPNSGEETLMRDDLRLNFGLYGATSPYGDGATITETIGLDDAGSDSTVDWIWVELRDATDPTIVIAGQSAILQRDGDVVDVAEDRITPLTFEGVVSGSYYVVIKHRNHLGIMTANTLALSDTVTAINFTDATNEITYGTNAQTTFGMPNEVVAMWAGDVNGDGIIQSSGSSSDVPFVLSEVLNDVGNFLNFPTYTLQAYNKNDANMDGNVQYSGANPDTPVLLQNVLSHPSNFLNFSTYQIIEQLPQQ